MRSSTVRDSLIIALSAAALVALWWGGSLVIGAPIILPTPGAALRSLAGILRSPTFLTAVGATALRGLAAFGLSFVGGLAVGLGASRARWVDSALQPLLTVIRSTPVMAVILLAMIWFRTTMVPVFVGVLVGFPIVFASVVEGVRALDPRLTQMARVYGIRGPRLALHVALPSLVPYLVGSASASLGLTWRVVVGAEILAQPFAAIGTALQTAQARLETAQVFAWTVVAIVLGAAGEVGVRALGGLVPWRRGADQG